MTEKIKFKLEMTIISLVVMMILNLDQVSAFCSNETADYPDYPYKLYGVTTLYDTVRGNITKTDRPDDCVPIHLVMVARHGSRHPGSGAEAAYVSLAELTEKINPAGNAEMCEADLEKIKAWTNWHKPDLDQDLAVTGYEEMRGLADRYSNKFPELFTDELLTAANYRIISSDPQRVYESANTFIDELFKTTDNPKPEIEIDNEMIRIWTQCPKWSKEVGDNATVFEDADAFLNGEYVTDVVKRVADRLGIPISDVSTELVKNMRLYGCAYDDFVSGNYSAWCLPFRKKDLEVFEYHEDMLDYIKFSYDNKINYETSCGLKNLVLSALKNASMDANTSPLGHFIFGHHATVIPFETIMKLIPDDDKKKNTEYPNTLNRTFRGAHYTPGSGNILFVLYGCGEEKKIQIFFNEKLHPMPLDNTATDGLWDLEEMLQYYNYYDSSECDYEEICAVENPPVDTSTPIPIPDTTTPIPDTTTSKSQTTTSDLILLLIFLMFGFYFPK